MDTKEDLKDKAEELDIPGADDMKKGELEDALEGAQLLGPVVPPGSFAPEAAKHDGKTITGIQPQTEDEIPEGAR